MIESILKESNTVNDAVKILEEKKIKSVFVVDDDMTLNGIFTRGDLRQFMLDNGDMNTPLSNAMNRTPITFYSAEDAKIYSQNKRRIVYPIIDEKRRLIDVLYNTWDVIAEASDSKCLQDIPLVIMAGGLGKRLYPLTKVLPKALIPIGDYTISERIINNFKNWGCKEIYFILNYKADMIKAYFEDLDKDYNIHYIKEEEFLGTGGGLGLLKEKISSTFILSNCDILVNADIDCLLKVHRANRNVITFVGAMKQIGISYGVLQANKDGKIEKLNEKPELSFLINTGVYVIEPEVINHLKNTEFKNLTDIAEEYISIGRNVGVFPITEKSWLDMGQFDEMQEMMKALGIEES